ncbi:MAG: tetratricopeptide repeat protein [Cyanobacteria bacterium P01_F01_bin.86]
MAEDTPDRAYENQRNLRRLVLAIEASYGRLNLLIAVSDNWKHRDELMQRYETELQTKGTRCYRVRVDHQLPSLKQCLIKLAETEADWRSQQTVVTVLGADELLGVRLKHGEKSSQEKFFFSLQWTREALRQYQVPIVLWLTPPIAGHLAQLAPDFWSWRGGVFEFSQPIAWTLPERPERQEMRGRDFTSDESTANPEDLEQQIADLKIQDAESPLLASLYMELGAAYKATVQYAEAASAYEQAVQLRETQLGPEHPSTAMSLNNLALLYRSMGRYDEAEPLYVRSLAIKEAQLGPEHPSTATSLNNLAGLYESMGRYGEAEPLYVRALAIWEKSLPPEHPYISTSKTNFRYLLQAVIEANQTDQLSEHPLTQALLQELQSS